MSATESYYSQAMMKKMLFIVFYCLLITEGKGQDFAAKINVAEIATTTLNLVDEVGLSEQYSLNLSASLNPWTFSYNKKNKHWVIRPEARYLTQQVFKGISIGFHAFNGRFVAGGIFVLESV